MAKRASTTKSIPSLVLLFLLLILSVIASCILAPVTGFLADKFLDIRNDLRIVLINTLLGVFLLLCLIFRNSLKANIRSSLNLPFYTVILHLFIGIGIACLFIAICSGILGLFGIKGVVLSFSNLSWGAFALSIIAAFAFELIFRGFVLQSLVPEISALPAIFISSAFFAFVSIAYVSGDAIAFNKSIDFLSGFKALPQLFGGFDSLTSMLPVLTGFFLLGALFALAYLKLGSLYAPIGMCFFIFLTEGLEIVIISNRLFVGRDIIFGSHGTILKALPGSIMAWILLLLAIIAFLCIGGIVSKRNNV